MLMSAIFAKSKEFTGEPKSMLRGYLIMKNLGTPRSYLGITETGKWRCVPKIETPNLKLLEDERIGELKPTATPVNANPETTKLEDRTLHD